MLECLPEDIKNKGISLESLGINDYAWDFKNIIEICEFLRRHNRFIIGGDVYSYVKGELDVTYDNWDIDVSHLDNIGISSYSIDKTIDYVTRYFNKNGADYLYSLTVTKVITFFK